jgi:hypothetical protein
MTSSTVGNGAVTCPTAVEGLKFVGKAGLLGAEAQAAVTEMLVKLGVDEAFVRVSKTPPPHLYAQAVIQVRVRKSHSGAGDLAVQLLYGNRFVV